MHFYVYISVLRNDIVLSPSTVFKNYARFFLTRDKNERLYVCSCTIVCIFWLGGITKCKDMLIKLMYEVKSEENQKHSSLLQTQIQDERYGIAKSVTMSPSAGKER